MWLGRQAAGLGLAGTVDADDLRALLEGRDPATGTPLGLAARRPDDGQRQGGAGGGRVRCHVLGAEVAVASGGRSPATPACSKPTTSPCAPRSTTWSGSGRRPGSGSNGRRQHPDTRGLIDGHVPPDHVAGRRPAAAHPRRDLGQGPDRRRPVAGAGCPLPEAPPADARRPVPVGAARRADPPLRGRLGADRQRPGRDRRRAARAARGVLEANRPGRRRPRGEDRRVPGPRGTRPDPVGAGGADPRGRRRHPCAQDRQRCRRICGHGGQDEAASSAGRPTGSPRLTACQPRGPSSPPAPSRSRRCSISSRPSGRRGPGPTCCGRSATSQPPVSQRCRDAAGPAALERACDRVHRRCVDLDPPDARAAGAAVGRPVDVARADRPRTSPASAILAEEERDPRLGAIDAQSRRPGPSTTRRPWTASTSCRPTPPPRSPATTAWCWSSARPAPARPPRCAAPSTICTARAAPVFGVAPTAKAATVLARRDRRCAADTVAKLLHEWRRPTGPARRLPAPARRRPSSSTKPAWSAPAPSTELVAPRRAQRWRLVLVGDPRQLQAVGRGGMFDELCAHRPHPRARHASTASANRGKQAASLQLRAGEPRRPRRLHRPRSRHRRHLRPAPRRDRPPVDRPHRRRATRSPSSPRPTNTSTRSTPPIQRARRTAGHLGDRRSRAIAGGETRRTSATSSSPAATTEPSAPTAGEPVRNRDRWTVADVGPDGSAHRVTPPRTRQPSPSPPTTPEPTSGSATPPPHTATKATPSTSASPSSPQPPPTAACTSAPPAAATDNRLLVVTDDPTAEARDVLEHVLANDRADIPAVTQRRNLARQVPRSRASQRRGRRSPPRTRRRQAPRRAIHPTARRGRAGRVRCRGRPAVAAWRA